jgi:hypothetical protein
MWKRLAHLIELLLWAKFRSFVMKNIFFLNYPLGANGEQHKLLRAWDIEQKTSASEGINHNIDL